MTRPITPRPPPPSASPPPLRPRASVTCPVSSFAPGRNRIFPPYPLLLASMHGVGAECGNADRDVLGALRRRVADALTGPRENCLACADRQLAALVLDDDCALEDDRHLVELGRLGGLVPAGG